MISLSQIPAQVKQNLKLCKLKLYSKFYVYSEMQFYKKNTLTSLNTIDIIPQKRNNVTGMLLFSSTKLLNAYYSISNLIINKDLYVKRHRLRHLII